MALVKIQLGKKGLTPEFKSNLKKLFETADRIRLSALKTATRDRKEIKTITEDILSFLGTNYTANIIGFTIVLRKWRKARETKR
jgi:RNA-binding protein YhbY